MVKKAKSKNHEIIGRFLAVDRAKNDKYFWPREMKLAGKLLKKYPYEFLAKMKEPFVTKMSSLAWFLTEDGDKHLNLQYFEYKKLSLSFEKPEIELTSNKIGEDIIITRKPKTLKEFLQYGQESRTD
jgi:hypothetical protein